MTIHSAGVTEVHGISTNPATLFIVFTRRFSPDVWRTQNSVGYLCVHQKTLAV